MDSFFVVALLINAVLSGVVAYVANQKGRSGGAFFALSFLLSFVVGILVVLALPAQDPPTQSAGGSIRVACPHCKESILPDAVVCKHCGRDVPPNVEALAAADRAASERENESHQNRRSAKVAQGLIMVCAGLLFALAFQLPVFLVLGVVVLALGVVRLVQAVKIPKDLPQAEVMPVPVSGQLPVRD